MNQMLSILEIARETGETGLPNYRQEQTRTDKKHKTTDKKQNFTDKKYLIQTRSNFFTKNVKIGMFYTKN